MSYAALYCRLSPRPDGSYEGVGDQEKWGREYAASKWPGEPVKVFRDRGISAANGEDRPGYDALRAAIGRGEVAHVWAVEQARLERREVEWFVLAAELDSAGITEVHTNRDGVVWVRGEVAGIKAVLAAAEVRKLTRRINDTLAERAAEGKPSGATPLGYRHCDPTRCDHDKEHKTLHVVREEADGIRWAADRILAGWSLANVATGLRDRGLTGSHGGQITAGTVKSVVTSPTVAGKRVHKGRVVGDGNWDAILDESVWKAVRHRLASKRTVQRADGGSYPVSGTGRPGRTARKYLLTGGVGTCGVCYAPLVASMKQLKGRDPQPYYLCHKKVGGRGCVGIQADPTEQYVVDQLLDELDKPEFLDAISVDDSAQRRDEIVTGLEDLDAQREDLAKLWAKRQLTLTEWGTAREALAEQEQRLRVDLAELPPPLVGVDISRVREGWPNFTLDERREIIGMFVAKVAVNRASGPRRWNPGRIHIEWIYE
jgi:DNA invertase Pin-like site-specific DNA recombinase